METDGIPTLTRYIPRKTGWSRWNTRSALSESQNVVRKTEIGYGINVYLLRVQAEKKILAKSPYKRCDQRNLMWVWISSHSFALKRIRFWMSSFHKQSTSSKVLYNVNLQAMWSEKSHVGLDFLTQLCAEKDPFLNVILPQAKYQ